MATNRVRRLVNLRVSTAQIRTAMYDDQEHLIVPVVVMKGDAVVRPLYSEGPEFVPATELALLPQSLDGRPVVPDHPLEGKSSANVPGILDTQSFGLAFNSKIVGKDLHCEAYINPQRAKKVGPSAEFVVNKVNAKEMVEISCGAYVTLEKSSGVSPSGVPYEFVWRDITFDHLAIGLNGSEGACSLEMGCGAPRVNKTNDNNNGDDGTRQLRATKDGDNVKGLAKRFKALFARDSIDDEQVAVRRLFVPAAEGMGSKELNSKLSNALFGAVPAYGWLWDSYPDDSTVIYTTQGEDWSYRYWMRSYSVDSDENVALGDDEQEMIFDESAAFIPKAAAKEPKSAACDCHKSKDEGKVQVSTMDKKARESLIARLLASARIKSLKYDEARLTAMSDETLTELGAMDAVEVKEQEPPKDEPKVEAAPAPAPVTITEEQLPQSLRDRLSKADEIIAEREKARAAKHAQLVANLKEPAKDVYTEDQLTVMSVEQLESTEKLLKLNRPKADYSGQGFPVSSTATDDLKDFMPPDSYGLVAARQKKVEGAKAGDSKGAN